MAPGHFPGGMDAQAPYQDTAMELSPPVCVEQGSQLGSAPPVISFEEQHNGLDEYNKRGKQVLSAISWLISQSQEYHKSFSKLEYEFRTFRQQEDGKMFAMQQKEDLLEHRFDSLESAMKKTAMMSSIRINGGGPIIAEGQGDDGGDLSATKTTADAGGDPSPRPTSDASPPLDLQSANFLGASGNLGQSMGGQSMLADSMTDLEGEVRTLAFSLKKLENQVKHQEQQQVQRDVAQDEIQRMEFAKMNRAIEVCIKEQEIEAFRNITTTRMNHIEAQVKEDAERSAKALKENIGEKITEVQSSLERIAENTDRQVRLIDERINENDAHDAERDKVNQASVAESRAKVASLGRQVVFLAEQIGTNPDDLLSVCSPQVGGDNLSPRSGILSGRSGPAASATSNRGKVGGSGAPDERLGEIERRLDNLDGGGDSVDPSRGLPTGSPSPAGSPSPTGSRPNSRGSRGREPLPARVERLEDKHEELVGTLEETLGITLLSDKEEEEGAGNDPSRPGTRPDSRATERSARGKNGVGLDRLSALEAKVSQLASSLGIEVDIPTAGDPAGDRPRTAGGGIVGERIDLLSAKLDEVASALGLTPEELESFARQENRGNLVGRVVLREEATAVSPRMAGLIAGQEDRLGQLDARLNDALRDLAGMFSEKLDQCDFRISGLEDQQGIKSPGKMLSPKGAQNRMDGLASEDINDIGATSNARGRGSTPDPSNRVGAVGVEGTGGTGGAQGRDQEEMLPLITSIGGEVQQLTEENSGIKARLSQLDKALEALRAGSPATSVRTELGVRPDSPSLSAAAKASDAARNSEAAAEAAAFSAEECRRLKEELAEIVNAVNIPSVASFDDSLFEEVKPVDGEDVDLDDEVRDDAARQYVERQTGMEARLTQLEEQLDSASVVAPESQIFSSLKAVIKDVRRCLSRCELLYQLPEIKMFVKRFQRSLEVNAILHKKWLGPEGSRRNQQDEDRPQSAGGSRTGSRDGEDQGGMTRDADMSRSAPDLRGKPGSGKSGRGKKTEPGPKKKPFRTVVDWVRPHTPLKIDPMFKGHSPPSSQQGGGGRPRHSPPSSQQGDPPHLPQIK